MRQTITKLKHEFKTSDNEMIKVFKLRFKVLIYVKSQDFEYGFINRCIYTNALLKQIGLVQSQSYALSATKRKKQ